MKDREEHLETIAKHIEYWLWWVERQHKKDGNEINEATHVLLHDANKTTPPHWPSVGQLRNWIKVFRDEDSL